MLTDNHIKAIFLECENKNPDGMYANDVDIMEFARKLEKYASNDAKWLERDTCITFVRSLNSEVAQALAEWRMWQDRSQ